MESQLLSLTNADRARAGLAPLVSSSTLVSIARAWSDHMAATGQLVHDPSLASKVTGWSSIGENIAKAYSSTQAENLFMGSAGHRANILKASYNRVGIGVSRASDGSYWFTVDFEQTSGYHSTPATHTTHSAARKTTHHVSSTSQRSTHASRASRSAVRPPVVAPALFPLASPAGELLGDRLTAIDARLTSSGQLALPVPRPGFVGPDPTAVAVIVSAGLVITALAGFATTRPPRVRVRGLPRGR
jgi:hypothetical protein